MTAILCNSKCHFSKNRWYMTAKISDKLNHWVIKGLAVNHFLCNIDAIFLKYKMGAVCEKKVTPLVWLRLAFHYFWAHFENVSGFCLLVRRLILTLLICDRGFPRVVRHPSSWLVGWGYIDQKRSRYNKWKIPWWMDGRCSIVVICLSEDFQIQTRYLKANGLPSALYSSLRCFQVE